MVKRATQRSLVVCVKNDGYAASLQTRKIYVTVRDAKSEARGMIRIADESGEAYIFPEMFFRPIELPPALKKRIMAAA